MNPSEEKEVLLEKREGVAVITLNRPTRGNSLTASLMATMPDLWADIKADPSIRCVILTGTGDRHFCTGIDVKEAAATGSTPGGFGSAREELRLTSRQNEVWKPTICAVNGLTVGAGLHFVVDSDIVVAADHAAFLDSHVNVGMVGAVENIGLAKRLPLGTALRMTLQGRNFRLTSERAYQLGLVDELARPNAVMDTAFAIARDICANSPTSVALSQRAVWSSVELPYTQAVEYGYTLLRMNWLHPDYKEGPRAFAEKRSPRWANDDAGA